ncbi:hypothetical protein [Candidatus Poriferisocius sp.]|uniref:hypothetical protein n=1 Tax=Candidatus Poriferisocius sp. TaxID=3101276 RepID=UPI003B5BD35F
MEAATLTIADLWPILATVLGAMLAFAVALMRMLHVSILGVHLRIDESERAMRNLIEEVRRENRELIEEVRRENLEMHRETRQLIEKVYFELSGGLADVRERLSRIEGHLGFWPSPLADDPPAAAQAD